MPSPDTNTDNIHKSSGAKKTEKYTRRKKSKKAPKCLKRLKIWEKTSSKRDCPHRQHSFINGQGPPKKWHRRESDKNRKYFCRSELYNDHLYHFCGAVVVVKTVIIGSSK